MTGLAADMEIKLAKLKEKAAAEIAVKERVKQLEIELSDLEKTKAGYQKLLDEQKLQAQAELELKIKNHDAELQGLNKTLGDVVFRAKSVHCEGEKNKSKYSKKLSDVEAKLNEFQELETELKTTKLELNQFEKSIRDLKTEFAQDAQQKDDKFRDQINGLMETHAVEIEILNSEKVKLESEFSASISDLEFKQKSNLADLESKTVAIEAKNSELQVVFLKMSFLSAKTVKTVKKVFFVILGSKQVILFHFGSKSVILGHF